MKRCALLIAIALVACDAGERAVVDGGTSLPAVEVADVALKNLDTATRLEGELSPFEAVSLFPRATGLVAAVLVDRGTKVKKGQLLVAVVAPEVNAQRVEAQAKLTADTSTAERLKGAAQTPGAVAKNEVEVAQATVQVDQARVAAMVAMEQYLTVTAPFDGVITERNVHPGALVGPQSAGTAIPMLRLEEVARLRLTVAVPEVLVGAIPEGSTASFTVRAWPGATFHGVVARVARSLDTRTRSMPVELDVENSDGRLAPGMFADVQWQVKREVPSIFVPAAAVAQSTERTYVVRVKDGVAEQVPVQRGASAGDSVEVFGALNAGDRVALRPGEELRTGTHVQERARAR